MNNSNGRADHNPEMVPQIRYVKYMVSLRCKVTMREELNKLGISYSFTTQGAIEFHENTSQNQIDKLKNNLMSAGLVLLDENESLRIDRIINTIVEVIHYSDKLPNISFSEAIFEQASIAEDDSIFKIFSEVKGMSIIQFIICEKIERAKELLLYDDIPLSEISKALNYKNVSYLVAQFKKITGLTPSYYKQLRNDRINIIENSAASSGK